MRAETYVGKAGQTALMGDMIVNLHLWACSGCGNLTYSATNKQAPPCSVCYARKALGETLPVEIDVEQLGRFVREIWVQFCLTRFTSPPEKWVCDWEKLNEPFQRVDSEIGASVVALVGLCHESTGVSDLIKAGLGYAWTFTEDCDSLLKTEAARAQMREHLVEAARKLALNPAAMREMLSGTEEAEGAEGDAA